MPYRNTLVTDDRTICCRHVCPVTIAVICRLRWYRTRVGCWDAPLNISWVSILWSVVQSVMQIEIGKVWCWSCWRSKVDWDWIQINKEYWNFKLCFMRWNGSWNQMCMWVGRVWWRAKQNQCWAIQKWANWIEAQTWPTNQPIF